MSAFNYFIENNCPFVFRYKYSNPNIIRTVFIKEHREDKGLIITTEAFTCKIKAFKTDGIHFNTEDLLPSKYESVYDDEALDETEVSVTHFDTTDLLPRKYVYDDNSDDEVDETEVSVTHFENDEEDKKCNDNKHQFLKYAIENNKTIAFEYSWNIHVMTPYRICNFGKSVLMYIEDEDTFRTYDIEQIRFVRIPEELREKVTEDENEEDEEETEDENDIEYSDYLESSCCEDENDDEYNTALDLEQSETFRELNRWDEDELDISAIDEINEW